MFSWVHGLQVGSKNRSKIEQKSITRWKCLPTSIFSRFWSILEAKLGGKIEPRQAKTGQDKRSEGKGKEEEGPGHKTLRRAGLEILIATFLAISLLFFFASFFDAFLGRSWLRFPSQLAFQNRPKSKKNRCQDAIHLGLRFLIDFWSVLALNLDPFDPKKTYFSLGKTRFFEKSPFEVHIDF